MPNINSLPTEILSEILEIVRAYFFSSLASSLRVSKKWHSVGLPLVYRHVVLDEHNIMFCKGLNEEYHALIRSFTIKHFLDWRNVAYRFVKPRSWINQDKPWEIPAGSGEYFDEPGSRRCPKEPVLGPESYIETISRILPNLSRLSTFSLRVVGIYDCRVFDSLVVSCLEELPEHCVNLELESIHYHHHAAGVDWVGSHICDSLRSVLARMENVRLCLPSMCSDICGRFSLEADDGAIYEPIELPNLRNLMIICNEMTSCHIWDESTDIWVTITTALQRLIDDRGPLLSQTQIFITNRLTAWDRCPTDLVTEMVSKTTLAIPSDAVSGRFFEDTLGRAFQVGDGQ